MGPEDFFSLALAIIIIIVGAILGAFLAAFAGFLYDYWTRKGQS
jgi:cytochrome c biogenesis protein ResB